MIIGCSAALPVDHCLGVEARILNRAAATRIADLGGPSPGLWYACRFLGGTSVVIGRWLRQFATEL